MEAMDTTRELFEAFAAAQAVARYTWPEIKDRGGPSSTTLTGLKAQTLEAISGATLRKLDRAYGWPDGTAADLVDADAAVRRRALKVVRTLAERPKLEQPGVLPVSNPSETSDVTSTVGGVERTERNVVRISAQAIGWELSATYTDAEDRVRALEDIGKAWAAIMGGSGNGVSSGQGGGT